MSTVEEWDALRESAKETGTEHSKDKEIRLLKLCIEKQQARMVVMSHMVEGAFPELEAVRTLYPQLKKLLEWSRNFKHAHGDPPYPRGHFVVTSEERDELLRIANDTGAATQWLEQTHGRPCSEPGCVLRPALYSWETHWHSDGVRQWKAVETDRGRRRFKRGAW